MNKFTLFSSNITSTEIPFIKKNLLMSRSMNKSDFYNLLEEHKDANYYVDFSTNKKEKKTSENEIKMIIFRRIKLLRSEIYLEKIFLINIDNQYLMTTYEAYEILQEKYNLDLDFQFIYFEKVEKIDKFMFFSCSYEDTIKIEEINVNLSHTFGFKHSRRINCAYAFPSAIIKGKINLLLLKKVLKEEILETEYLIYNTLIFSSKDMKESEKIDFIYCNGKRTLVIKNKEIYSSVKDLKVIKNIIDANYEEGFEIALKLKSKGTNSIRTIEELIIN